MRGREGVKGARRGASQRAGAIYGCCLALQVSAHVQALEQKEDMLLQANRDLNAQLDRAELEVTRADRQRQTAMDRCSSLQKQCQSLQDMTALQISAQAESKMHVHGVQRAKRSREDKIQAHVPVQGIM